MFFCFTGKFRDLLTVFFHDIHFSILLFILRKKRGQLDLREKKKITVLCQITKFQAFLQVFLYISSHTHLRKCDFHAFPPHVSFFSFYHLEYAMARTRATAKLAKLRFFTGVFFRNKCSIFTGQSNRCVLYSFYEIEQMFLLIFHRLTESGESGC